MASMDDLLAGLPRRPKKRIHHRRHMGVSTATIRSDINVTPLVDVVLVLLIIFMVVTPMITRGMPVEMPITIHHDKKQDSGTQIFVSVTCNKPKMGAKDWECDGGSSVFVGPEKAEGNAFQEKVQAELRKKGTEVYIKADRRAKYGAVREVMERCQAIGLSQVSLGTVEPRKEE